MQPMIHRGITAIFLHLIAISLMANQPAQTETSCFSLLTCAPSEKAIYTLFGHTAIRYQNPEQGVDVVFNYGLFNFNTPNFVWRFVKGETDYLLGATDFQRFAGEYAHDNRTIWQQTLNLTEVEKECLFQLLMHNYQPENRTYRYNYFYDNCSTRPRDRIEESVSGTVNYVGNDYTKSFRNIVHEATEGHYWDRFGMDLCLGAEADKPITFREEMFSPIYLMSALEDAVIVDEQGNSRPVVKEFSEIVIANKQPINGGAAITPGMASTMLLVVVILLTCYGLKKRRSLWGIDLFLFTLAGLAGCVLAFLAGFSLHPAVGPNYLLFVFHPLHLLLMPFFIYKEAKERRSLYHIANLAVLTLFIATWPLNPQHFNIAVLPLALCLLIRSASNVILNYKNKG